jgi:hypothetical protein
VPHWSWCVRLGSYVLSRVGFFVFKCTVLVVGVGSCNTNSYYFLMQNVQDTLSNFFYLSSFFLIYITLTTTNTS